ncbi:hypothetical protein LQZ13_03840 [Leuconostoc mesenteroides]|uniref:hypothetical protein n=1 Tax=Leuconostoc mesenteroides TaxID=1245 RepID=UPI002114FA70|nr:hypothetical protein [Leuconostoc mesenteroides]UUE18569.1 hypothetical protein LQZ13_03840 [Leuconostoc mesenteroides]
MTIYKITAVPSRFMDLFNSYYDYEYQNGEYVSDKDYEELKKEVDHFNETVTITVTIKLEKL